MKRGCCFMNPETQKLLRDALNATEEIQRYTSGITWQEFVADTMRQNATNYMFAVLGEALSKLRQISRQHALALSDIQLAIDMRNRLIHGYSSVDAGIVWATARQDIPNLCDELNAILEVGESPEAIGG